jgi:transcriptional regulator with XRE-family HTH domain
MRAYKSLSSKLNNKCFASITSCLLYIAVMPAKHETLASFVSRILTEKNLSYRQVAARSGGQISHATVADIANAQRFDIKKDTLIALARGLDVPADDIFRVARGLEPGSVSPYEIYAERFDAHDLTETEWQLLEAYFNDYVKAYQHTKAERQRRIDEMVDKADKPRHRAPVVARIEPGKQAELTRDEVRRMIDTADTDAQRKGRRKTG